MNLLHKSPKAVAASSAALARRAFTGKGSAPSRLRIGYVPEHFLTPFHFALRAGLEQHVEAIPFPRGTGTMVEALADASIDAGIGLTDAWVAGLANAGKLTGDEARDVNRSYHIYSSFVTSPLRWAISTGSGRQDINSPGDAKTVGVSRLGSGSHIMSYVLAQQQGWLNQNGKLPYEPVVSGDFAALRAAVADGTADFFMWEHFTTKKYYDNGELKNIGEIPTPWNGWHIAAAGDEADGRLDEFVAPALTKGIQEFQEDKNAAVEFISTTMAYSAADAAAWYDEVVYPKEIGKVDATGIEGAIESLQQAGVIEHDDKVPWQAVLGNASRAWGESARAPR